MFMVQKCNETCGCFLQIKINDYCFILYACVLWQGSVDNIEIEDIDGHGQASARHIYSTSIRSLKNELLQQFDTGELLVNESDVRWVLTTSVCFPDDSRFFMSECAKQVHVIICFCFGFLCGFILVFNATFNNISAIS